MKKDKHVKTVQGNLEIWEHDAGLKSNSEEQQFASRIFNKEKSKNIFKVHTSAKALEVYIEALNLPQ